jgi:hypothetical protein
MRVFFDKHSHSLDGAYCGFIKLYCRGPMIEDCRRFQYFREHDEPPAADMLPSGAMYRPV